MNRPLKLFINKESQSGIIGYLTDFECINRNRYSGYIRNCVQRHVSGHAIAERRKKHKFETKIKYGNNRRC